MADTPTTPTPTPAAAPAGTVQDLGATSRITPTTGGNEGPTLEEQAAAQAKAAGGTEAPAPAKPGEEAPAPAKPSEEAPPAPKKEGEDEAPKPVDLKGTIFEGLSPDMQTKVAPFAAAYAENGTLTEAEITEAAHATGMSEAVVRQFMAGAAASAAQAATPIYEQAGGQEQFSEFRAWTAEKGNLTAREEATINKAIENKDYDTAAQLMAPAMERWKAAGGAAPARDVTAEGAGGTNGAAQATDVYESWAQLTADQGKPEYRNDPAFRAKVEQKIARSPKLA